MLKQLLKTDKKCLYKFAYNMGIKGARGIQRFQKRIKKGDFFPAFHFISVTDDCNLNCQGCWVTHKKQNARMSPEMLDSIITQSKGKGSYFFGILGGEPLLYKPLFDVFEKHSDCYFQLFTNGTLLTREVAERLRKLANVSPLISFEGDQEVADVRRGGKNVYQKAQAAIDHSTEAGLITGVAMGVCKSNIDLAFSDDFIQSLIDRGVLYLWYYIYRPAGQDATVDLCLSGEQIEQLRQFMVDARRKYNIAIIDAYWDENGKGLCPAASGLSHHINASGDIEPCPVIQFATNNVADGDLESTYRNSTFLAGFKIEIPKLTTGCIVMDDPQWLVNYTKQHAAKDTSGRDNEAERLSQMEKVSSHGSAKPVREKSWVYRFAKKRAFLALALMVNMKETNGILKVPEQSFVRNKMRKAAANMIEKLELRPPVNILQLEELAADLVREQEISAEFIPFAMVLLGNESWRKTVKATPMNRRLLLLPQCLNDKEKCEGLFDELGLNCAGCKACPIDDILIEAEAKGYANLVAEGTTVAVGLVEEGSIDAVIGVSCMPVLQRSFEPVSNAAVPVIGIPLLFDGCEETRADIKWILDEIRSYEPNEDHHPISVSLLKNRIEDFFTKENIKKYIQGRDKTEQIAQEYMLIDGQRIRPLLAALSYLAYSTSKTDELLKPLTLIIECFHKASLIHDDIEDNANQRYNTLTAHEKYGVPQAINAGDFLIGKGYELLSDLDISNEILKNCLRFIARSHIQLTRGQGVDILFNDGKIQLLPDEMIGVFKNKTGEAIKVALLLGAIVGGAKNQEQKILEQFADFMGIAYQIRDDLNEYTEQHSAEKTGDYPFLLSLLNKHFADQEKEIPTNLFEQVAEFRKLIDKTDLLEVAKEYLQKYVDNCYAELDKLKNSKLRLSLYGVMGKIFKSETTNE